MVTVAGQHVAPGAAGSRFVLYGMDWEGYETMLKLVGDRPVRVTYDRGNLELLSPSQHHERFKTLIGILVQALTEELDIACIGAGSTTWRREDLDRGLEPDECFYLFDHAERYKGQTIDLATDSPPDLTVEIDITHSSLDRQGIYAALGVPEVWRFDGSRLRIYRLRADKAYDEVTASHHFPFLPTDETARRLREGETMVDSRWGRQVREWVRNDLAPRYDEQRDQPQGNG
jgi:Uma2 family endonuclease